MHMPAYTVTAGNKWYFQKLVVIADNATEAAEKFHAYLTSPESLAHEVYEREQVSSMDDETDPEALIAENYKYVFHPRDVEEFEDIGKWQVEPTAVVQMIHSGGNG